LKEKEWGEKVREGNEELGKECDRKRWQMNGSEGKGYRRKGWWGKG